MRSIHWIPTHAREGSDWAVEHSAAIEAPVGPEKALVYLVQGWLHYAESYTAKYGHGSLRGDSVLGPTWRNIGNEILTLLNGEVGRLDPHILDVIINEGLREQGWSE